MSDQATIEQAATDLTLLRRTIRAKRRAFAASADSAFVKAMKHAMGLYLQARRDGVSREDAEKGLELEIRGCWPKGVSKFAPVCSHCGDTGWMEHTCWDQHRCGREVCAKNPERQHLYVEPCACQKGDRLRAKVATQDEATARAGRTAKRKAGNWKQVGT